jgi:hypothetical protein
MLQRDRYTDAVVLRNLAEVRAHSSCVLLCLVVHVSTVLRLCVHMLY